MKSPSRLVSGLLSMILIFSFAACTSKEENPTVSEDLKNQIAFDEFINTEFQDSIRESYLTMHQTTIHPEQYGVDPEAVEVSLGPGLTPDYIKEVRRKNEEAQQKFSSFNYDTLRDDQKETYAVYQAQLQTALDSVQGDFVYMPNYFSPMGGLQSTYSTLFMEYDFYKPQDVADYITLMNDVKRYTDEMLQFTKTQAEKGFFMSSKAADESIAYCDKIINGKDDSALLKAIHANIDQFDQLTDEQKSTYKEQATKAFHESIIPSYVEIRDTLSSLKNDSNNQLGLAHLPNGKEYYEMLFREKTGSSRTIEETKELLQQYLTKSLYGIATIASKSNTDAYEAYVNGEISSGYSDFNKMLEDLDNFIDTNFPPIESVPYTIDYLDPQVSVDGIGAYYVVPPLDSDLVQKMKVNPNSKDRVTQLDTFSTIAHEGLPGHLYQHNYVLQHLDVPYRQDVSFLGYAEGYATYVELLSLEYLDLDPDIVALSQNYTVFQNCLTALTDIGIHYEGWDLAQTQEFFDQFVSLDVTPIFDQIQANPAAFLPYYVGYIEFMELKNMAQMDLGDKFNELDFHTAILKSGSAPFDVVKKNVEDYITQAR